MAADREWENLTDELYASAPAEFVGRRDELAKRATGAGDRELARAIKALRRPSVGAWYLNLAARSGLTSLRELLRLGRELRDAQTSGDFGALKELAAQRTPLVSRVVRDLTAHLAELGVAATTTGLDEVRTTLASALADPEVAEAVSKGRLDRAHAYSGFGDLPLSLPAVSVPKAASPQSPEPEDPAEERLAREREAARQEREAAERDLADAASNRAAVEADHRDAAALVESLTDQLTVARDRLAAADEKLAAAIEREQRLTARVETARRRQS